MFSWTFRGEMKVKSGERFCGGVPRRTISCELIPARMARVCRSSAV